MALCNEHYLFIIVGASATGKSEILKKFCKDGAWKSIPKYSTRDSRDEDEDIAVLDYAKSESSPGIKRTRLQKIKSCCENGKGVVYYKNENIYGIEINQIVSDLKTSHLFVIASDFHAINTLKNIKDISSRIKVLYIASTMDEGKLSKRFKNREHTDINKNSEETMHTIAQIQNMCDTLASAFRLKYLSKIEEILPEINEKWNSCLPNFDTIKARAANIRVLYNRYIDNISIIDGVILNFYDLQFMYKQVENLINNSSPKRKITGTPIFMVCAALSSGKATLMEIVGDLGEVNGNIIITKKYAKRDERTTDGRDGMIAIGSDGDFKEFIESDNIWTWSFHVTKSTEYAVCHNELKKNIRNGIAQIFISNMQQIENAKMYYPNNIVILYLHATHEAETKKHIIEKRKEDVEKGRFDIREIEKRIQQDLDEIANVHYDYIKYNDKIDHVLLNTGTREDLIEQMINLIDTYSS
jgi:guanylate kinase